MSVYHVQEESDLEALALKIRLEYPELRIYLLRGDLGAGKTAFVKKLVRTLGTDIRVSSPTFGLVNDYDGIAYHFDLYRIKDRSELSTIGFEEYLDSGKFVLIEWPDLARELISDHYLIIDFNINADNSRDVYVELHEWM